MPGITKSSASCVNLVFCIIFLDCSIRISLMLASLMKWILTLRNSFVLYYEMQVEFVKCVLFIGVFCSFQFVGFSEEEW